MAHGNHDPGDFTQVLDRFWAALTRPSTGAPDAAVEVPASVEWSGPRHALPSAFDVTGLAAASVAAASLALAELAGLRRDRPAPRVTVDSRHAAVAFRCERHVRPEGWSLPPAWDPVAGDYAAADGFVRLHTNYAHHRAAALSVLGLSPGCQDRKVVAEAVAAWEADALETAVVAAGGCAAAMRTRAQWQAHPQGQAVAAEPLVARMEAPRMDGEPVWLRRAAPGRDRPATAAGSGALDGVRVLDLTRVIAGPIGTRLLAAHGADVLRIDPPGFEEVGALLTETSVGKRRAALDLRSDSGRATLEGLLRQADVLVHGYRSGALPRLGFGPERLRRDFPQLIVTQHNAYGASGPWRDRRGFDSLVQMGCGIAATGMAAYGKRRPYPLPAQALDHATGYLGAAATCRALSERLRDGRVVHSQLSLAATAEALWGLGDGERDAPEPTDAEVAAYTETADSAFGPLRRVRLPGTVSGCAQQFTRAAGPLGCDPPTFGA